MRLITLLALTLATVGCVSAPDDADWANDVKDILASNCVRCHSEPSIGGAPRTVRLDTYDWLRDKNGVRIIGAGSNAEFINARVQAEEMPPNYFNLTGRQKDTIANWYAQAAYGEAPPLGTRSDNRHSEVGLLEPLGEPIDGFLPIRYEVRDPDGDLVIGELHARNEAGQDTLVTYRFDSGRGEVLWDVGSLDPGRWTLVAALNDGDDTTDDGINLADVVEVPFAEYDVVHPTGNVAPTVSIVGPDPNLILIDANSPTALTINVRDPDAGDTVRLTVVAENTRFDPVLIAEIDAVEGDNVVLWDTTAVPQDHGWIIRATANDGTASRSGVSKALVVSHVVTDLRWGGSDDPDGIQATFKRYCTACHPGDLPDTPDYETRLPGFQPDFNNYGLLRRPRRVGVGPLQGSIYTRAVIKKDMPARSLYLEFPDLAPLGGEELDRLAEWLLGGAPE